MNHRMRGILGLVCGLIVLLPTPRANDLATEAANYRHLLSERLLPYWYDTAIDWTRGGYVLADDAVQGRSVPTEKQLVTQAQLVWSFSLAHRKGFSTPQRDYLKAAAQGVNFLRERMRDREKGGYFWSVTLDGLPRDLHKRLYGESFVIDALVEYFRAGGDRTALDDAVRLYFVIQLHAHDKAHRGWLEHFERDWAPLAEGDPNALIERAGYKSANTHLHLLEALTELYAETKDATVKRSLEEALDLNMRYFYPEDPARSALHLHPDWTPVTGPHGAGQNYGRDAEFAWRMIRAEEVLGRRPSWVHFQRLVDHALLHGTDRLLGGVYHQGRLCETANDTSKVWWAQAEMLAALTEGLRHQPANAAYTVALGKLISFVNEHQADPKTGVWLDTVNADGTPFATGLAHNWKANYHDVRGLLKFIEAFEPKAQTN